MNPEKLEAFIAYDKRFRYCDGQFPCAPRYCERPSWKVSYGGKPAYRTFRLIIGSLVHVVWIYLHKHFCVEPHNFRSQLRCGGSRASAEGGEPPPCGGSPRWADWRGSGVKLAFFMVQWSRLDSLAVLSVFATTVLIVSTSPASFISNSQYNSHALCHKSPSRSRGAIHERVEGVALLPLKLASPVKRLALQLKQCSAHFNCLPLTAITGAFSRLNGKPNMLLTLPCWTNNLAPLAFRRSGIVKNVTFAE